ncbi:hypothetical protein F4809DRAFT_660710 [Biscogniauxia mediterranea]|nr:hypothetical protein F4809DRAFT_660710 [Biscogniauxia mediterranea]
MILTTPRDERSGAEGVEDSKSQATLAALLLSYLVILAICWVLIALEIRKRKRRLLTYSDSGADSATEAGGRAATLNEISGAAAGTGTGTGVRAPKSAASSWSSSSRDSAWYTEEPPRPGRSMLGRLAQKVGRVFFEARRRETQLLPAAASAGMPLATVSDVPFRGRNSSGPYSVINLHSGLASPSTTTFDREHSFCSDGAQGVPGRAHGPAAGSLPAEPAKALFIGRNFSKPA